MATPDSLRRIVAARAGGACEYCRLMELGTGSTFHVEHVLPMALGGTTTLDNLAFSCSGCNLAKGKRVAGRAADRIFNPRAHEPWLLGWYLHFELNDASGLIVPRTATGKATIETLNMNAPQRVFARLVQIRVGLIG
jgi:hypothetical protein